MNRLPEYVTNNDVLYYISTVVAERSFSLYKNYMSNNCGRFTFENIRNVSSRSAIFKVKYNNESYI